MNRWQMGILLYIVANCVIAQFMFISPQRKLSALILIVLLGIVFIIEYFERRKKRKAKDGLPPRNV